MAVHVADLVPEIVSGCILISSPKIGRGWRLPGVAEYESLEELKKDANLVKIRRMIDTGDIKNFRALLSPFLELSPLIPDKACWYFICILKQMRAFEEFTFYAQHDDKEIIRRIGKHGVRVKCLHGVDDKYTPMENGVEVGMELPKELRAEVTGILKA